MKKTIFSLALAFGVFGMVAAHTTPDNKPAKGNPGGDSSNAKDHPKAAVVVPPKNPAGPPAPKAKIIIPVKKEKMYELKAPSIFTFTVINTFFEMPIQKK